MRLLAAIIPLFFILCAGTAQATTVNCANCSDCNEKIASASSGDMIQLNESVSNQADTCISFGGKDNLTFDCLSHSIGGDGSEYGIWLNDSEGGSNNNTVRNCIVSDFYECVYLDSSSENVLMNISVSSCNDGVSMHPGANNNTLTNITASANEYGIYIYESSNNTLSNITIAKNAGQTGFLDQASPPYRNSVADTVTVNGKQVLYFDGYYRPCPDDQILDYNDTYAQVSFLGCMNVTLMNTTVTDSVNLLYTNHSRIYGINSSYSAFGFGVDESFNNTLSNITVNHNSFYGIYIYNSSNNSLDGLTASHNTWDGLWMLFSHNNTFTNVNASSHSESGIYLGHCSWNTFTNVTAYDNARGILIGASSEYNTVNDSRIMNNTLAGIFLDNYSTGYSRYNSFFNNILNNSVNLNSASTNNLNYWNSSNTTGPNIIGGHYIGGNYWSSPYGNGTSENCTDSNYDGYCDSEYALDGNNTDYLPLTISSCEENWICSGWSACYGGSRTRTCTDSNSCGTFTSRPATSQLCETPGGSGGGGGGGEPAVEHPQVNKTWEKIEPGAQVSMSINKSGLEFSEIKIEVKNPVSNISIKVTKLEGKPAEVSHNVSGKAYQYVSVNATNLDQGSLKSTGIRFRVSKSWIRQNNIDRGKVCLNRYEGGEWVKLNTSYDGEDADSIFYISQTPGFSYFAITGEISAPSQEQNQIIACNRNGICEAWENLSTCPEDCRIKQCEAGMLTCRGSTLEGCRDGQWVLYKECENGCLSAGCLEAPAQQTRIPAIIIIIISGIIAITVELVLWRKRYSPWRYFRV